MALDRSRAILQNVSSQKPANHRGLPMLHVVERNIYHQHVSNFPVTYLYNNVFLFQSDQLNASAGRDEKLKELAMNDIAKILKIEV
mgnify:CR=1 FL=1